MGLEVALSIYVLPLSGGVLSCIHACCGSHLVFHGDDYLRPFFPKFHGSEVKAIGDSFLVEFDSALDATNCATEVRSFPTTGRINSSHKPETCIRPNDPLGKIKRIPTGPLPYRFLNSQSFR